MLINCIRIRASLQFRASLIVLLLLVGSPVICLAQPDQATSPKTGSDYLRENYAYRFETTLTYEHLSPHSDYGDWTNGDIALYAKVHHQVTAFGQLSHHSRSIEGDGQMAVAGAYVDWLPWLTTYSAISFGSGEDYLPEWRIDHDFNFPIDPLVFTLGASYIDYGGKQNDRILSAGITWYHERWITEYRFFQNTSDPGSVDSNTHLLSVGYGQEGWHWVFLKLSSGAQAYQTTSLADPEDIRQDANEISLYLRHWLGKDWGIMEKIGFLSLESGYDKHTVSIGFFKEF